jgi:glycosyltransferase involved in cell wall biosynthesis
VGTLWRLVGAADLVHVHDALYPGSLLGVFFAKLRRKPALVTQHVGIVPYESRVTRAAMVGANLAVGRAVHRAADQTVFYSHVVRDYYRQFVRFRRPPAVVPNGVDAATFFPGGAEERRCARADLGLKAEGPVLLFVGRFVEKKGLSVLRTLASEVSEAMWLLAGHGDRDPTSWSLQNVVVRRGLAGATLRPLYQVADVLVLPSVGEGFPLVVQEAMACGTPALVNSELARAQPEAAPLLLHERVLGPGRARETARLWAARIRDLLAEPRRLVEMRPAVAAFARKHWSWDTAARRYAEIMRGLLERR